VGLKTNTGSKAPQEALVEHRGALTPIEAAAVKFVNGMPFLPKSAVPKPAGCVAIKGRKATFVGRVEAFADQVLNHQRVSAGMAGLLRAAQRSEVPMALLPDQCTPLGKWLHGMPFAVKFKVALLRLAKTESFDAPAYYSWFVRQKCPNNQRDALAAWLNASAPQQVSQAA
jgi:hypothetical protein